MSESTVFETDAGLPAPWDDNYRQEGRVFLIKIRNLSHIFTAILALRDHGCDASLRALTPVSAPRNPAAR